MLATHCAAQSSSLVPNTLSSAGQTTFRNVARELHNPCPEENLSVYQTLEDLLDAGQTCYEASILTSEIEFFIQKNVDQTQIKGLINAEAKGLASPAEFRLENRPRLGESSAPVEVVIFSDFQCPFCANAAQTVHKVHEARPEAVSFVFKHMPLTSLHPYAAAAALVSVYANEKGQFWEVHDKLFSSQSDLSPAMLAGMLESMGTTSDELFEPQKGQKYGVTVIEDLEDGTKSGVDGTPFFFVNGAAIVAGDNYEHLIARIEAELKAPAQSSPETRKKAKERALATCPYPGHEEMYSLMPASGRADLSLYTNSVLCPCPGISQTLHDCTIGKICPAADPLIDKLITRIMENVSRDDILNEIEDIVRQERTKILPPQI